MSDTPDTPSPAAATPALPAPSVTAAPPSRSGWIVATLLLAVAAVAAAVVAALLALNTQQRVKSLEAELVKRQQDSGSEAAQARMRAQQAETAAREAGAQVALLQARVAESSVQRSQLDDMMQSLARSRDENLLADLDAALRVAQQQAEITGSAEPLLLTLKQADERLARYNQPRLERVRRAVAGDLERVRSAGTVDIGTLTARLDDLIRQLDDLPLLSGAQARADATAAPQGPASAPASAHAASAARHAAPASAAHATASAAAGAPAAPIDGAEDGADESWGHALLRRAGRQWQRVGGSVWQELKGLIRVTRIDEPEAVLLAPEQALYLRENLKLRLLNARLALLSRQFDVAQADVRDAQAALARYFDRDSRRVAAALDALRQIAAQARQVSVPRPDATLAALATAAAAAGR